MAEEKEVALQTGITLDVYIDNTLKVLDRLNPVQNVLPLIGNAKEGGFVSREDARLRGIVDTWLTTYDEVLKRGKTIPMDLIGRAAQIARNLNHTNGDSGKSSQN